MNVDYTKMSQDDLMRMVTLIFPCLNQDLLKSAAARAIYFIKEPGKGLGTELFEAIIPLTPQTAVESIIVDSLDMPTKVFLTWRDDKHYRGWHCPGKFMLIGESFRDVIIRTLKDELGVKVKRIKETPVSYSRTDSRGHTAGTIYLVVPDVDPLESLEGEGKKWFSYIPCDTLEHHKEFIKRAIPTMRKNKIEEEVARRNFTRTNLCRG